MSPSLLPGTAAAMPASRATPVDSTRRASSGRGVPTIDGAGRVRDPAVDRDREVQGQDVAVAQRVLVRQAVQDGVVHRQADDVAERAAAEGRRVVPVARHRAALLDAAAGALLQVHQVHAGARQLGELGQGLAHEPAGDRHLVDLLRRLQLDHRVFSVRSKSSSTSATPPHPAPAHPARARSARPRHPARRSAPGRSARPPWPRPHARDGCARGSPPRPAPAATPPAPTPPRPRSRGPGTRRRRPTPRPRARRPSTTVACTVPTATPSCRPPGDPVDPFLQTVRGVPHGEPRIAFPHPSSVGGSPPMNV